MVFWDGVLGEAGICSGTGDSGDWGVLGVYLYYWFFLTGVLSI